METCTLSQFVSSLKPWLSGDYIRSAGIDENDLLRISSQNTRTRHYDTPHLPKADDRPIKGLDFLCLLVSAPQAKHRPRHQRYV